MGREIRRVPPHWEHPKEYRRHGYDYKPLFDRDYNEESAEWLEGCILWAKGEDPSQKDGSELAKDCKYYWEWAGPPPSKDDYVPYDPGDKSLCTWWQCYETVSEGTPVSPPFATPEELIDYLATQGDFWEQRRAKDGLRDVQPCSRESVERFVKGGWAPSMVVVNGVVAEGVDGLSLILKGEDNVA